MKNKAEETGNIVVLRSKGSTCFWIFIGYDENRVYWLTTKGEITAGIGGISSLKNLVGSYDFL